MKQNQELSLIENPKLDELVKQSGIELTKAESHVKAFHPSFSKLSELSRPLASLDKESPTKEHALIARENRLGIVKIRTGAESIKEERKRVLLAEGNLIQSAYNLVKDACIVTESEYEEIEKYQERKQKEEQAKIKESRLLLLAPFEVDTEFLPLDIMDEEKFQTLLAKSKEAFEAVTAQRIKAEQDRIEAERIAEEKRIAEELAEQERIKQQAIENERLKKEAEAREKELAKERAEAEKKAKEQEAILKSEREAREKIEAELRTKQEQEELEKQQAIAEQQEREAQAKASLLAPDKEKINELFKQIRDFTFPQCQTEEAAAIINDIREGFKIILQGIKDKSNTLK